MRQMALRPSYCSLRVAARLLASTDDGREPGSSPSRSVLGTTVTGTAHDAEADHTSRDPHLGGAVQRLTLQLERDRWAVVTYLACTVTETQVLSHMHHHGPRTIGEVATALDMRSSVVTGIADRLEGRGLVSREAVGGDRRRRALVERRDDDRVRDALDGLGDGFTPVDAVWTGSLLDALALTQARVERETDRLGGLAPLGLAPRRSR